MKKPIEYWRDAKARYRILKYIPIVLKYFFQTNSAFWLQRNLLDELPELKEDKQIEFNFETTVETLDYIRSFKERWMNNPREIEVGIKEKHFLSNAKYNGKIVAIHKIGIYKVYVEDYKMILSVEPDIAFNYHIYVAPEFRKKRIGTKKYVHTFHELRNRGFEKVITSFAPWNIGSGKLLKKIGYKKIAYIRHFRILNTFRFWFIRNLTTEKKVFTTNLSRLYQIIEQ